MEIIRKKISLDKCKTRVNCALPFIPYNEPFEWKEYESGITESFGGFLSDINGNEDLFNRILSITSSAITTESPDGGLFIRTRTLFSRYNQLLEMLRKGLHLKHIKDQLCINGIVYSDTYIENFEYDSTTYEFLRESEVVGMYDESGETQFNYIENNRYESNLEINADYVIVLDDFDEFQELGGKDLIKIVDEIIISGTTVNEPLVPYVPIHVLMTCDEDDLGVMTPYEDDEDSFEYKENVRGLKPHIVTSDTIQVESKLQTLKVKNYLITDNGYLLKGCLSDSDRAKLINGGGDRIINLELPFTVNFVTNKNTSNNIYTGDYIESIYTVDNEITFVYYIGKYFTDSAYDIGSSSGGVKYEETYQFENIRKVLENDTIYLVSDITYKYIDVKYDDVKVTVYSEDFNLYRDTNIGNVTEFNVADVWTREGAINTPLFKEEYLMGAAIDSDIDLDIEIDRGNAAAFERHLILTECNTYSDIENYRNNLFNL